MCELMGLCLSRPVAAEFSISAFAQRDHENADGWGLAWYSGLSVTVVKEPLSWRKSGYAKFLGGYDNLLSHMYIAHVRRATVGGAPKHADTHPFARELGGRNYCFAHNGTVRKAFETLLLERFRPIGQTDSEHVFCYLLDAMAERGEPLTAVRDWHWLAEQLHAINRLGKFNCLFSDGQRMFAYHDREGFKGLFVHAVRVEADEIAHLEDPEMEVALESDTDARGIVIATRPLSDIGWHAFQPGELLVLEHGRIAFSSMRSTRGAAAKGNGRARCFTKAGLANGAARPGRDRPEA